jgi:hypothetical protein
MFAPRIHIRIHIRIRIRMIVAGMKLTAAIPKPQLPTTQLLPMLSPAVRITTIPAPTAARLSVSVSTCFHNMPRN